MSRAFHRLVAASALTLILGCASAPPPAPARPAETSADAVVWQVERPANVDQAQFEIRLLATAEDPESVSALDVGGSRLHLARSPILTARDIARVEVALEIDLEHYAVVLYFTPAAARRLAEVTRDRLGHRLALLVDGHVLFAPYIQSVLSDSAMISNRYGRAAAVDLAMRLAP